jgi:hypothetical protein
MNGKMRNCHKIALDYMKETEELGDVVQMAGCLYGLRKRCEVVDWIQIAQDVFSGGLL